MLWISQKLVFRQDKTKKVKILDSLQQKQWLRGYIIVFTCTQPFLEARMFLSVELCNIETATLRVQKGARKFSKSQKKEALSGTDFQ